MDEFWGITIVLFIVLAVLSFFITRIYWCWGQYNNVRPPRRLLTELLPELKTGDIVLFIAYAYGLTSSMIASDLFTHGGMVVEIDGELFISETTSERVKLGGASVLAPGARATLTPLLSRLDGYAGACFLVPLTRPLTPEAEARVVAAARERGPYPTPSNLFKRLLGGPKTRHCMQHVGFLLETAGLVPPGKKQGFFSSSRGISGISGEPLLGGYLYDEIVEVMVDVP